MSAIEIDRGDTHQSTITLTDDGVAFDVSGCTVWVTAKARVTLPDSRALFQARIDVDGSGVGTSTTGLAISGVASGGVLTLSFTADETAAFSTGTYIADIQVLTAAGQVITAAKKIVEVKTDITQATS